MGKLIFIITIIVFISWDIISYAGIYKYVDKNGVTHYTNMPTEEVYKKTTNRGYRGKMNRFQANNPADYRHIIDVLSEKYSIEPSLIHALIKVESDWDSTAISLKGAKGLMQLMPVTAREMNVKNPFNPEENIEGGIRYLKSLLDRFNGDLSLALAAYNAGPRKIKKYGDIPPIPETQHYVKRVLLIYNGKSPDSKKPNPHI